MENRVIGKYTASFGLSFAVTSLLNALLVIAKEKNEAVMALMKGATGHHWITQGALVLAVFLVVGYALPSRVSEEVARANRVAVAIVASTAISGLIVAGFFLM